MIEFQKNLDSMGLTRQELVDTGILIGTDFNPDGFERVGPKTAIKMIKQHKRLEDIPQIQAVSYTHLTLPTNREV